ncbi:aminopeptidase P N-terminal domain-containing protein [Candidatus Saccharibacteria bacterium]|nr:aminopeptidase P N-terminal domain-containing protein [Candidatus Saccharibacteria bacterium]
METYFSADFFRDNRKRLMSLLTVEVPIVITANALQQRNNDVAHSFRQDANFWYLTGITEPEIVLVIDKGKEYLIMPKRSLVRNIFDGNLEVSAFQNQSGVHEILDFEEGWKRLGVRLKQVDRIAMLKPPKPYIEQYEFYTNPARSAVLKKLKSYSSGIKFLDLREQFVELRMVKQNQEIDVLKRSIELTIDALKDLRKKLPTFEYEYEIEAHLLQAYRTRGARQGYAPIIAGGANACVLHYDANDNKISKDSLLLIDTGAEFEYYSADISRTFALSEPTKRQNTVFRAVLEVQDFALSNLKPGISIRQNEKLVEAFMGEKLYSLGLIKSATGKEMRKYFPHATSHFLGIDVHDLGNYDSPLLPGMVLTVEPGIYISEEGLGIRIEDDVLITETGVEVLSQQLPREL